MARKKMLLDCDPGLDDALALLLAHSDSSLELVAVTTVGGNVALDDTTNNALKLREFLGFPAVPVASGAAGPLVREAANAAHVHGEGGLGSVVRHHGWLIHAGEHDPGSGIQHLRRP